MASAVTSRLSLLVAFLAIVLLPLPTKLEYTDMRQPVNISAQMLNDDLIVPKTGSDCPEPDEIGCTEIQAKNNDALIYPTSKLSTAKPSLSTRRQAEAPLNTQTSPTRSFETREKPCNNDDDEDCSETSGDGRASISAVGGGGGNSPPDETILSNRRSTQVISEPRSPAAGDGDWPGVGGAGGGGESSATGGEGPEATNETGRLPPGETTDDGDEEGVYEGGSTPSLSGSSGGVVGPSSQKTLSETFRNHYQLAINMNIILIVGIAIGIVILLLILIVAICKYKGQGAKAPPMGKSDRAKSYTYEACNTGPPLVASAVPGGVGDPGEPVKTKSSTSIAVGLPTSPGAAGNTTTITAPVAATTVAAPHSKPARKGVKEWYV